MQNQDAGAGPKPSPDLTRFAGTYPLARSGSKSMRRLLICLTVLFALAGWFAFRNGEIGTFVLMSLSVLVAILGLVSSWVAYNRVRVLGVSAEGISIRPLGLSIDADVIENMRIKDMGNGEAVAMVVLNAPRCVPFPSVAFCWWKTLLIRIGDDTKA